MKEDMALLTFCSDLSDIQRDVNNLVAVVPLGITKEEELFQSLDEQLHFPAYFGRNWDSLDEVLSFWMKQSETQRAVIIHQDLPFVGQTECGWYWLKIYLEILIKNIAWAQKHSEKELVVIFPLGTADAVFDVLTHQPAWELEIGFREQGINVLIDPSWPEIVCYLERLNGLTAEVCTIFREDVGAMTVLYLRKSEKYYVECKYRNSEISLMASPTEDTPFSAELSFLQMQQIIKEFFTREKCLISMHWFPLAPEVRENLEYLSYLNDEEVFVEGKEKPIRGTIIQEMLNSPLDTETIFPEYWKRVLSGQNTSVSQRITALCVIGFSHLPENSAFFLPFLESSVKKESWVSAVFLGMMGNELVIPTLINMLTDELPILVKKSWSEQDNWYENWRSLVPRLLRKWQTAEVLAGLQNALAQWIRAESFFDPDFDFWRKYEAELCYELGYRENFSTFTTLKLEEDHRHMLMIDAARGYLTVSRKLTLYKEHLQQKHFWRTYRLIQADLISVLNREFGIPSNVARDILKEYRRKNELNFI